MLPSKTDDAYTAGILFLRKHLDHVRAWMAHATQPFFIRPLNEHWGVLFIEDDTLSQTTTIDMLVECSKFVSLLYFFEDENWGWGYRIYVNGFEVACFYDDYHFEHTRATQLAAERYPHIPDILSFLYFSEEGRSLLDALIDEVNRDQRHREAQFRDRNVEFFKVFHLEPHVIAALSDLISLEGLRGKRLHWKPVRLFKEYLGIVGLHRMNFTVFKRAQTASG